MALLTGCAQRVLDTEINAATIRLLTRLGCEVVVAEGAEMPSGAKRRAIFAVEPAGAPHALPTRA
mgnify:CR=1 FL=1